MQKLARLQVRQEDGGAERKTIDASYRSTTKTAFSEASRVRTQSEPQPGRRSICRSETAAQRLSRHNRSKLPTRGTLRENRGSRAAGPEPTSTIPIAAPPDTSNRSEGGIHRLFARHG